MTTTELIAALRNFAEEIEEIYDEPEEGSMFYEAADRLEELDERVALMAAEMDEQWGNKP